MQNTFRFAIVKRIDLELEQIALEYNEDQIKHRLKSRVKEKLIDKETRFKRKFTKDEILNAVEKSFEDLIDEFKKQSIKFP